jgi:probable rRNA maturation factor
MNARLLAQARAMTSQRSRQSLIVQYAAAGDDLPARPLLRRWVRATLGAEVANTKVVLRFVDEAEGRALNRRYRRRDRPTNVLSFVYDDGRGADGHCLSGDIVLCAPLLRREATQQGKPLAAHCAHLVVHGMLHLQGYDHAQSGEVARMEALEIAILARLGFGNPYVMNPGRGTTRSRRIRR